jgi:hypothetical protein
MPTEDPRRLTRTVAEIDLKAAVLKVDPTWYPDSMNVVDVRFSNGREFKHYWQTRGPYGPPDT